MDECDVLDGTREHLQRPLRLMLMSMLMLLAAVCCYLSGPLGACRPRFMDTTEYCTYHYHLLITR